MLFPTKAGATGPHSPQGTGRARVVGLAAVVLSGVLAVPVVGWLGGPTAAQAQAQGQSVQASDRACTRILEGTEWLLDPCIPEGEPLPQDILDALALVRFERECQQSTSSPPPPTSTSDSSTWSPPPTSTLPSQTTSLAAAGVQTTTEPPATTEPPTTTEPPATTETTTTTTPTCPTETTPPPTSTTETTSPTGTTEPTEPIEPPPAPSCPEEPVPGPAILSDLDDARADRIECRDPATIPDRANPVVLVATGDSLTSAHHQFNFGAMCQNTSADLRNLTGNNAFFSYAGRYYNLNPNIVEYYNFARTGFGTKDMLGAGMNQADACGNAWGRAAAPVALADAVIRKAKADGRKAYFVTTGGVNNTNWTTVLSKLIECRALEFAQQAIIPRSTFAWNAQGGKAGIVTNGGGCTLRVRNPWPFAMDFFHRVGVPAYDGPLQAPGITADVTAVVNRVLAAGADKVVWMLYYDINPATVDIANLGLWHARANAPQWVVDLLPVQINPNNQGLVDPLWVGAVRNLVNALNAAITAGIPNNARVRAQPAPALMAADIQRTAIGGSPHPSAAGQTKLANTLNAAFIAL